MPGKGSRKFNCEKLSESERERQTFNDQTFFV
jgi:hypothetical protein